MENNKHDDGLSVAKHYPFCYEFSEYDDGKPITEHDLFCIAKHIQIHVVKGILHNEGEEYVQTLAACENCERFDNCSKKFYRALVKLGEVTGVPISIMSGFNIYPNKK